MKLFGQDQLAQTGGLQAIQRAVVLDGDGLVSAQQAVAVHGGQVGRIRQGFRGCGQDALGERSRLGGLERRGIRQAANVS